MTEIASLGFALAIGLLAWQLGRWGSDTSHRLLGQFDASLRMGLADMFVFVEPGQLRKAWLVLVVGSFFLAWLLSGQAALALIAAVLAGFAPRKAYVFLKARRERRFLEQLPDSLQELSASMRAGSSLPQSLEMLIAESRGPVAQEFALFLRELRLGVNFDEALAHLQARMPLPDLRLVIAGMRISREVGGNLGEVLERLADTLRRKIEMEGKIDSLTAQGKLQGLVMTGLPIFLGAILYQMEPEHMSRLFTEIYGWLVCAVVAVMEFIGYRFIRKIVSIDV